MDSSAWDERYAATELVWSAEPNRFVREEVGGLTPGRALDLAAGEGRNSLWMATVGWQVRAVDFSVVAIEKGRRLADELADPASAGRIDWVVADIRTYEPPEAAFDLVLLCYLQLPSPERVAVLSHAGAALVPGGVLLVVGHALANLTGGMWFEPRFAGELPDDVRLINQSIRSKYELVYQPTDTKQDGTWRKLRVELVNAEGKPLRMQDRKHHPLKYKLIYRDGYRAKPEVE